MTGAQRERYLSHLGCPARPPSLDTLAELVRAHLARVPFENVSKLWRLRRAGLTQVPPLEEFLDGAVRLGLGGTCYANAAHLNALLRALGYGATLHGADMSTPDAHLVNVVALDGRPYLVDVGYGAPFLAPLPLDVGEDQVVTTWRERFVLRPRDADGASTLEQWRDGTIVYGYRVRPAPRDLAHFGGVVADSFRPTAWFMNRIVLARFSPEASLVLRNLSITEVRAGRVLRSTLPDVAALPGAVERLFGIPADVTAEALRAVKALEADPAA